jgi:transcriptional regulator with XRE-family HTH domain
MTIRDTQQFCNTRTLIKEALATLGWSESRLSRIAGVSQPTINRFMTGTRGLSEGARLRIMSALQIQLLLADASAKAKLVPKNEVQAAVFGLAALRDLPTPAEE